MTTATEYRRQAHYWQQRALKAEDRLVTMRRNLDQQARRLEAAGIYAAQLARITGKAR